MTAPKQLDDGRQDERASESGNSNEWEENEPPTNHNYYKNHPNSSPQLTNVTSSAHHAVESADPSDEDEAAFTEALRRVGLELVEQDGDGNCLFRAVSLQVYGDPNMYAEVREKCINFMAVNKEHYGHFVTGEPFESYIARKRKNGCHGNNPEINAISELFNRPIQIFTPRNGARPLNIFHAEYTTSDAPIRLSYHDGSHYNAVIDPSTPTAGLGLGLPNLKPGLADKLQVATATTQSDIQHDLEQAIKASQKDNEKYHDEQLQRVLKESALTMGGMYQNKALALSDAEDTEFDLEQSILEASLQSYQMQEGGKQHASATGRRQKRPAEADLLVQNSSKQPPPAAAAASSPSSTAPGSSFAASREPPTDEYPAVVQELVMNGFGLPRVVRAYELLGDNFDDLLAFLMSNTHS
mmetsp:Transcript_10/g.45  ORF Transcript_10/g.45 Transcript_10/m.45 type:complete len:412 (+) Transcript_10:46-1281(+)